MPILSKYVIKCDANSKMLVKKSYFIQYLKVFKSFLQNYSSVYNRQFTSILYHRTKPSIAKTELASVLQVY